MSEIQIYKAGIRLADMLNAIFDPKSRQTPFAYIAYIFVAEQLHPTLDKLCHVNIQFENNI